ncbi:hypothetical protein DM02DRAFT_327053 [Periconia macrospinosa]|uniref:Uncharacterized protein n=1 Tax=Periconia macrospinosa TaxID=97972 RepID=A0A2V1EBM6_9PLEO|nr:hypothetical protein DM02DRAFT_327053 [Periconia macrospinosa]
MRLGALRQMRSFCLWVGADMFVFALFCLWSAWWGSAWGRVFESGLGYLIYNTVRPFCICYPNQVFLHLSQVLMKSIDSIRLPVPMSLRLQQRICGQPN